LNFFCEKDKKTRPWMCMFPAAGFRYLQATNRDKYHNLSYMNGVKYIMLGIGIFNTADLPGGRDVASSVVLDCWLMGLPKLTGSIRFPIVLGIYTTNHDVTKLSDV
jgi:hypothetical protein